VWAFTAKGMLSGWQWERESRSKITYDFFPKTKIEERGKTLLKSKDTLKNMVQKERGEDDLAWLSVYQISAVI